jgi:antirestriction protein ArdC
VDLSDSRKPNHPKRVSRTQCLYSRFTGIPITILAYFQSGNKLGGRIRKGEKSSPVIFWNIGDERETTTQDGAKETSRPFLLRYYSVFNLSQAEGIDIPASLLQETRTNDPIITCEQIVANMPSPPGFEQSDKAWYSPNNDLVGMPARGLFHSSEEYYATEFHELAHNAAPRVMPRGPAFPLGTR